MGKVMGIIFNLNVFKLLLVASAAAIKITSDPICNSAGCTQYLHPKSTVADWPRDYGVPHLGMAEGIVKHHWVGIDKDKWANPAKKVMYNFAAKLDGDIVDSQKNLADTEKILDHTYQLS